MNVKIKRLGKLKRDKMNPKDLCKTCKYYIPDASKCSHPGMIVLYWEMINESYEEWKYLTDEDSPFNVEFTCEFYEEKA